jgi:hypothetical protein
MAWFNSANAELGLPQATLDKDHIFVPVSQCIATTYPGILCGVGEKDTLIANLHTIAQEHRRWQERMHGRCPWPTVTPEAYHSLRIVSALFTDPLCFLETADWGIELSEHVFREHLSGPFRMNYELPGHPMYMGIPRLLEERLMHARTVMQIVGDNLFHLIHVRDPWEAYQAVLEEHREKFGTEIEPVLTKVQLSAHIGIVLRMWSRRSAAVIRLTRRFKQQHANSINQDISTMVDIIHLIRPESRPPRDRFTAKDMAAEKALFSLAYPDPKDCGMRFSERKVPTRERNSVPKMICDKPKKKQPQQTVVAPTILDDTEVVVSRQLLCTVPRFSGTSVMAETDEQKCLDEVLDPRAPPGKRACRGCGDDMAGVYPDNVTQTCVKCCPPRTTEYAGIGAGRFAMVSRQEVTNQAGRTGRALSGRIIMDTGAASTTQQAGRSGRET